MKDALVASDGLIGELEVADVIVLDDDRHEASVEAVINTIPVLVATVVECLHADQSVAAASGVVQNDIEK